MSERKRMSKITLGMLKGKSATTSVPTFAIKFHTEDEELEEIFGPSIEQDEEPNEKPEPEISEVNCDFSNLNTNVSSREPSPMKEYLKGLGSSKRSISVDAGQLSETTSSTPPMNNSLTMASNNTPDAGWRLFHELKGKITKTVEEKFGEMKRLRENNSSISDNEYEVQTITSANESPVRSSKSATPQPEPTLPIEKSEKEETPSEPPPSPPPSPIPEKRRTSSFSRKLSKLRHRFHSHDPGTSQSKNVPETMKMSDLFNNEDDELTVESGVEAAEEGETLDRIPLPKVEGNVENQMELHDFRTTLPTSPFDLRPNDNSSSLNKSIPSLIREFIIYDIPLLFLNHRRLSILFFCILVIWLWVPLPVAFWPLVLGFTIGVGSIRLNDLYHRIFSNTSLVEDKPLKNIKNSSNNLSKVFQVPAAREHRQYAEFSGWMNEYPADYDPETYHIGLTQSVYVRLENGILRISHSRSKIPKRASWNERTHKLRFTHQRIYNISGCEIKLLPEGLARRRIWSKKYPICVQLSKNEEQSNTTDIKLTMQTNDSVQPDDVSIPTRTSTEYLVNEITDDAISRDSSPLEDETDIVDVQSFTQLEKPACLYLFARADREKEEWYRRLKAGARSLLTSSTAQCTTNIPFISKPPGEVSAGGGDANKLGEQYTSAPTTLQQTITLADRQHQLLHDYNRFMGRFDLKNHIPSTRNNSSIEATNCSTLSQDSNESTTEDQNASTQSTGISASNSDSNKMKAEPASVDPSLLWLNTFITRLLFDFLRSDTLQTRITEKIQRKLATLKLPYFVEHLSITEFLLGNKSPTIHRSNSPRLDEQGLWFELDFTYEGSAALILETKLNFMKLRRVEGDIPQLQQQQLIGEETEKSKSPMFDSDLEDSAESSEEDYSDKTTSTDSGGSSTTGTAGGSLNASGTTSVSSPAAAGQTSKRLLNMVNKITQSKYFKQATEYKYIRRAMEEVSNTPLYLAVEIRALVGTLVINVPPPPTDRIWYGFKAKPQLYLIAKPKLGEREVTIGHLTSWIEKKLVGEFQKLVVMPNMDDLVVPLMMSELPE